MDNLPRGQAIRTEAEFSDEGDSSSNSEGGEENGQDEEEDEEEEEDGGNEEYVGILSHDDAQDIMDII